MVHDTARRYRLGPRFLEAWEQRGGMSLAEFAAVPPDNRDRLWAEFAFTTNVRGLELAWQLARRLTDGVPTLAGRSSLDVGCGLGGTAVECARLGAVALGIEPDAELLGLARANGADSGTSVRFESGDLLDPTLPERLGTFDAVVAQDVLEHVDDAAQAVHALSALVAHGGLVVATIPNGDALSFVRADGHYLLPGLTLLRHRPDAVAYHAARITGDTYDVGNYHSWDAYESWFGDAGLTIMEVEHVASSAWHDLDANLAAARQAIQDVERDGTLPESVRSALAAGWSDYMGRVDEALSLPRLDAERRITVESWQVYASLGPIRRMVNKRMRTKLRSQLKRIPGATALVRTLRDRRPGSPGSGDGAPDR